MLPKPLRRPAAAYATSFLAALCLWGAGVPILLAAIVFWLGGAAALPLVDTMMRDHAARMAAEARRLADLDAWDTDLGAEDRRLAPVLKRADPAIALTSRRRRLLKSQRRA